MKSIVTLIILTLSSLSHAAPIHDAVRKLEFKAVEKYFKNGEEPNVPDETMGNTPLAIAIEQAYPKALELKNYPFNKKTFMFIKKMLNCGVKTTVAQLMHYAIEENPYGDKIPSLDVNEADPHLASDSQGNCEAEQKKTEEPACLSATDISEFMTQIKTDAPNMITSVVDIFETMNDYVFEEWVYFEARKPEVPEFKMVRLLMSHGATLLPEMTNSVTQHDRESSVDSELQARESRTRIAGNAFVAVAGAFLRILFPTYVKGYPTYAAGSLVAVKTVIDIRNFVAALFYKTTSSEGHRDLLKVIDNEKSKVKK